jgi:hypothetical protein
MRMNNVRLPLSGCKSGSVGPPIHRPPSEDLPAPISMQWNPIEVEPQCGGPPTRRLSDAFLSTHAPLHEHAAVDTSIPQYAM